ncbi:MAG: HNH endonuclease [Proteobacteria bacterium]|jgi:5-methylcytosine-specific restriction endonuclease McrA|nr:HNH endonuclease [Pseudomonadota bacterium]
MHKKQTVRSVFRKAVFKRDRYACRVCGQPGKCSQTGEFEGLDIPRAKLDAHHITDRDAMPNGGYVAENGISLCEGCHNKAESGDPLPDQLYELIGSSRELAIEKSMKLI